MTRKIEYGSLTQAHSILNGFLAGCLIAGSIFNAYGLFLQGILFLVGLFVLVDTVLPSGEMMYALSVVFFAIIGFLVILMFSLWQVALPFLIVIFLVTFASYFFRFKK